ncbi:hypothetical protein QBC46DRAFT_22445 [Diplogelasinospora grovesii]|uniref:BZIP domain-containing protein n=1 Tax=Diplogelasinospora grovesii TaxID=303347 RepID=A0AAN6NEW9_9PEZI|nr:hypothetical protein QBC46DRAFT_22445 [Diplogelasinospora grovesii]
MSTPAEKANLARIRDNQRRSRARRKEYLQELEQRLRLVELQGIEASSEIQLAARKVAEENKKLRMLLNRHGINDDSIDAFLGSGIVAPPGDSNIASQYRTVNPGNAVQTLEQLLGPRRPTCLDPNAPFFPMPPGVGGGGGRMMDPGGRTSRETSVTSSISTVWDGLQPPANQHGRALSAGVMSQPPRLQPQQQQQYVPPTTAPGAVAVSRPDLSLGMPQGLGSILEDPRTPRVNPSPTSAHPDNQSHGYNNYDMHMMQNPSAYNPSQQQRPQRPSLSAPHYSPTPGSSPYIPTTSSANNCSMATDMYGSFTSNVLFG